MLATSQVAARKAHYTDTFNRADSTTSLGADWTNRSNQMGIGSNQAYAATYGSLNCSASYNSPMLTDNHQVSITLGVVYTGDEPVWLTMGASTGGEGVQAYLDTAASTMTIYSSATGIWTRAAVNSRASTSSVTWTTGTVFTLKRVGRLYTVLKNGSATGMPTWTDSGGIIPCDPSHRLVGIGGVTFYTYVRAIDAFAADDL